MATYGKRPWTPRREVRLQFENEAGRAIGLCHHSPRNRRWKDGLREIPAGTPVEEIMTRYTICNACHPPLAECARLIALPALKARLSYSAGVWGD